MSKAKFEAAKELIQEKKYKEARIILEGIDHPTAKVWLKKLDEIEPRRRRHLDVIVLAVALPVLVIALVFIFVSRFPQGQTSNPENVLYVTATPQPTSTDDPEMQTVLDSLRVFCMKKAAEQPCIQIAALTMTMGHEQVIRCFQQFGSSVDDFGTCVRPQFAAAYDQIMEPALSRAALIAVCQTYPAIFYPKSCTDGAEDLVTQNPKHIIDDCFTLYFSWNVTFDLSPTEIASGISAFGSCVILGNLDTSTETPTQGGLSG